MIYMERFTLYSLFIVSTAECVLKPSFETEWMFIAAQAGQNSQLDVFHGQHEIPVKVDVQVKVNLTSTGTEYIFSAKGSAHGDDDSKGMYSGVIYTYDEKYVYVYAPNRYNGLYNGMLVFIPSQGDQMSARNGFVKVRVWTKRQYGEPCFESREIKILEDSSSNTYNPAYLEIEHKLGKYPDLTSVQVYLSNGKVSDAQGNALMGNIVLNVAHIGGTIYGYNDQYFRIWTYGQKGSFALFDGWGRNEEKIVTNASLKVTAWCIQQSMILYTTDIVLSKNENYFKISIPSKAGFEGLIIFKVAILSGKNEGFIFQPTGTYDRYINTVNNDEYGYTIFSFSEDNVVIYCPPPDLTNGYKMFVGGIWGFSNIYPDVPQERSKNLNATIEIINLLKNEPKSCELPIIPPNTYLVKYINNERVIYVCHPGYHLTNGSLLRLCNENGVWQGDVPLCEAVSCNTPNSIRCDLDLVKVKYSLNDTVTCQCQAGLILKEGNVIRSCLDNGTVLGIWSGSSPVCEEAKIIMKELQTLIVSKQTTTASKRKKISAQNKEPSAAYIGAIGVTFLVVVFGSIIMSDVAKLIAYFCLKSKKK